MESLLPLIIAGLFVSIPFMLGSSKKSQKAKDKKRRKADVKMVVWSDKKSWERI